MACFVGMLVGLLKTRSVNLAEIATGFVGDAGLMSRYRRLQRFVHGHRISYDKVACFVMTLFGFTGQPFYLTMDRTNWKWGRKDLNILVLAVVYRGVAIPVYWLLLNKRGNSNAGERIALMKRFVRQFGKERLLGILADREFIGERWLAWLKAEGISFCIRIKKDAIVPDSRGELGQVQRLFRHLAVGQTLALQGARQMTGVAVHLTGLRLGDGELLIVATDKACPDAIGFYSKRWQIETLFSCLKGRGFNLEDTRVTDRARIKRLLVVPVVAFCWAHKVGEWRHEAKPITVKKHLRPAKSIFRYGLDWLRDNLLKTASKLDIVCQSFVQLIQNNKVIWHL